MLLPLLAQAAPAVPGADDGNLVLWAVVLLLGALVLLVLELFLPSGGLLGVAGAVAALSAVGCFFAVDPALGFASLLGLGVVTPVLVGVGLKIWPHTPIGRRLVLGNEFEEEANEGVGVRAQTADFRPAVGAVGESLTPLRRVGTCRFEGHRVECLADGDLIDAGRYGRRPPRCRQRGLRAGASGSVGPPGPRLKPPLRAASIDRSAGPNALTQPVDGSINALHRRRISLRRSLKGLRP